MARKLIQNFEEKGEMFVMVRRRMGCGLALETYFDSFDSTLKENESYDATTDSFAKERNHSIKYHSSG